MAFESIRSLKLFVAMTQQTFIIGDYFVVYERDNDVPYVFEWRTIKGYAESTDKFMLVFGGETYTIPKSVFPDTAHQIAFRTIVEGEISTAKDYARKLTPRIIPPKYNYRKADFSSSKIFTATGAYVERDISSGSVAIVYSRVTAFIWLIALGIGLLLFGILSFALGELEKNMPYILTISFFVALGFAVVMYLVCCIYAKCRYASYLRKDISTVEPLVFIVAPEGFGAVEKCVYTGNELIPWSLASHFFETKNTIVIFCKDKSICRIPKRLFPKTAQNELVKFIAARLVQE